MWAKGKIFSGGWIAAIAWVYMIFGRRTSRGPLCDVKCEENAGRNFTLIETRWGSSFISSPKALFNGNQKFYKQKKKWPSSTNFKAVCGVGYCFSRPLKPTYLTKNYRLVSRSLLFFVIIFFGSRQPLRHPGWGSPLY